MSKTKRWTTVCSVLPLLHNETLITDSHGKANILNDQLFFSVFVQEDLETLFNIARTCNLKNVNAKNNQHLNMFHHHLSITLFNHLQNGTIICSNGVFEFLSNLIIPTNTLK